MYKCIHHFNRIKFKWHSVARPYTLTILHWLDFINKSWRHYRSQPLNRIMTGFHRTFATGEACRQGRSFLQTPGPSHLELAVVLLVETNPIPRLVEIFPDYALRTSLGTFSILHALMKQSMIITLHISISNPSSLAWKEKGIGLFERRKADWSLG